MNKCKKWLKFLLCLTVIGMLSSCKSNHYTGGGITFLSSNKSDCILNVYDYKHENIYKKKLGDKSEVFWLTSTIYPDETIAVDNNNIIYVFKEDEIKTFEGIVENIIEVHKWESQYIIIHADENSSYIDLWKEDFSERLSSVYVEGVYDCSYMDDANLYFTVYDDKEYSYSKIYNYSINCTELNLLYETNLAISMYPFFCDNQLYAFFNKKITDIANEEIYKVYKIMEGKQEEIMSLGDCIKKIINYNGENYALLGEHSTYVNRIDLIKGKDEKIYDINAEIPKGIFLDNNDLYIMTDNTIYYCDNNTLVAKACVDGLLVNEFR